MSKVTKRPGRPRKAKPLTPAERMRAYRKRKRAAGLKEVRSWLPEQAQQQSTYSDHRILEARSLSMHCKIAQKISRDPTLLEIPRRNLERWTKRAGGHPPRYILEWERILSQSWPTVAEFITSGSEQAVRLRQSSPFAGVLSPRERKQIYDAFRA